MNWVCVGCGQPIGEGEEWFRVQEEYVHRSCYDKYLKLTSARKKESSSTVVREAEE